MLNSLCVNTNDLYSRTRNAFRTSQSSIMAQPVVLHTQRLCLVDSGNSACRTLCRVVGRAVAVGGPFVTDSCAVRAEIG